VNQALAAAGTRLSGDLNVVDVFPPEVWVPVGGMARVRVVVVGNQEGRVEGVISLVVPSAPVRSVHVVATCGRMVVGCDPQHLAFTVDGTPQSLGKWVDQRGVLGDIEVEVPLLNSGTIAGSIRLPTSTTLRAAQGQPLQVGRRACAHVRVLNQLECAEAAQYAQCSARLRTCAEVA
jgi:hypothetical protein